MARVHPGVVRKGGEDAFRQIVHQRGERLRRTGHPGPAREQRVTGEQVPVPGAWRQTADFFTDNFYKGPSQGYDAAGVLFAAMKTVGKPDGGDYNSDAYRAKLRDAIAATKGYKGATGDITLDADRNAHKPAVVLQIKGSSYKNLIATFQP